VENPNASLKGKTVEIFSVCFVYREHHKFGERHLVPNGGFEGSIFLESAEVPCQRGEEAFAFKWTRYIASKG
jgi:hypothetical protein